jgi:hypothetical protein
MEPPVLRVFWPTESINMRFTGLLYGWRSAPTVGGVTCVIAGIISAGGGASDDERAMESALFAFDALPAWEGAASLKSSCSAMPQIIGEWVAEGSSQIVHRRRDTSVPWLVLRGSGETEDRPIVVSWSGDAGAVAISATVVVVLYRPPELLGLQYFSSRPCNAPPLQALGAKLLWLTRSSQVQFLHSRSSFDATLSQINAVSFLTQRLKIARSPAAASLPDATAKSQVSQLMVLPLLAGMVVFRALAWALLGLLRAPMLPGGSALFTRSTLAAQVHLKLCEFCTWPLLLRALKRKKLDIQRTL